MAIIHIVDDDAAFRKATSRLLRAAGYDVEVYESAEQLLARLPVQSEPGCILLDVIMPGLSGPELQERLTKLGSTLPTVFLTAGDGVEDDAKYLLTKPVSKDTLLETIERALRDDGLRDERSE